MRVWKYEIAITAEQTVMLPRGAKILACQWQGNGIALWAEVEEALPKEGRGIAVYGTGNPIPHLPGVYVATVQVPVTHKGGGLVFHVYDLGS